MKRTFKDWIFYKTKRAIVYFKLRQRNLIRTIAQPKKKELSEIQKPLFSISLRLISNPDTELRSNSIDYTYHIESDSYLVIIRPGSNDAEYSVSLIEYKRGENAIPAYVDMPIPSEWGKIIVNKFEKEVQRRMKTRQIMKTHKVASHLHSILKEMESR